ncbi:MAG TPA: hypothetical protein VFK06_17380 [Candidatus Angelobacter sp.]|nr:hypothetical protein [Candidatus Angelobacter sp.]
MIAYDQVAGVQQDGFAIVSDVLSAREISLLIAKLTGLEAHRSRAGFRHLMTHPVVRELVHDSRLHMLAQQVLGADAFAFCATLFDKSPDSNWLITWHQDTALPLQEKRETPGWGPWSVKMGLNYAHAPAGRGACAGSCAAASSRRLHGRKWASACDAWNAYLGNSFR